MTTVGYGGGRVNVLTSTKYYRMLLPATSLHRRRRLLHKSRWGKVPPISWQCSEPPSQLEPRWRGG